MSETIDPFSGAQDASRETCEIRPRTWGAKPPQEVRGSEWVAKAAKARRKRVDLNPLQREWFRENGWTFIRVEKPNAFGAVTVDLWAADYLACKPGEGILLVQVTDGNRGTGGGHAASRLRKVKQVPEVAVWLATGGRFEIHAWSQPGGPQTSWRNEVRLVKLEDL